MFVKDFDIFYYTVDSPKIVCKVVKTSMDLFTYQSVSFKLDH